MAKRIMVVDDSKMVYMQMKNLLADCGEEFEVAAYCRSGEEALDQYDQVCPDLVTMDIIMPGMDGIETTQALLEEHPGARIIMLSSLAYDDTVESAENIGARGFIDKPLEKEPLLEALRAALE